MRTHIHRNFPEKPIDTVNYWTKKPLDKYHVTSLTMQHIADSTYFFLFFAEKLIAPIGMYKTSRLLITEAEAQHTRVKT